MANSSKTDFRYITTTKTGSHHCVAVITLNTLKSLNVLCRDLLHELAQALDEFESDKDVGAIVIAGSEKAFSFGYNIKELPHLTFTTFKYELEPIWISWDRIAKIAKPIIAAVNGYVVGGGCELAMMCDIVYAGENAKFSQPEILIGTIPGFGATQRLTKTVGKSKAMEMLLTGWQVSAQEAEKMGLISKVFPADKLLEEAIKLGEKISKNSQLINAFCKECVNVAYETPLKEGLRFEKKIFHSTFATKDRKEGMLAFLEKRVPHFTNE